jgi:hypothetical protein
MAMVDAIITSLYRQGNLFVQCFVLSRIDILFSVYSSCSRQKRLITKLKSGTPRTWEPRSVPCNGLEETLSFLGMQGVTINHDR